MSIERLQWQLTGSGPEAYERYLVPAFFAGCAEQLLDAAAVRPGERVLDVACGTGIVARLAAARVGAGGTVAGVDVNEGMVAFAKAAAADAPTPVDVRSGDAAALPFADTTFDVVCCQQGMQFFTDRPGALREMRRVLAPGGRVALAVWRPIEHHHAFPELVEALDRHAGSEASTIMRAPFGGPDRDELREIVVAAGFGDVRARIGFVTVRFPSAREFLRQEVVSSPLAGPVGELDEIDLEALARQVEQDLAAYVDDDGLAFVMQTWLVSAYRR